MYNEHPVNIFCNTCGHIHCPQVHPASDKKAVLILDAGCSHCGECIAVVIFPNDDIVRSIKFDNPASDLMKANYIAEIINPEPVVQFSEKQFYAGGNILEFDF